MTPDAPRRRPTAQGAAVRFLSVVLVALAAANARAEDTPAGPKAVPILAGCEYDYAPFCIVREDGQADGFSVELLRAALQAVGRDVAFKAGPWSDIKQDLVEGRLQALPMVARSRERESDFDFTFPYYTMHGAIVVRDDNTDIHGPADLKGKRVAVLQEDIAHEYLRNANLGAEIVPLPSFAQALHELSEGKHDAVVVQKLLAFQIMKEAGLDNLRTVGPPLSGYSQVLCFAVRKGDTELLRLLNEGLSIVMANGVFRRLHAEWFAALEAVGRTRSRIVVGGDSNYPPYEFLDANGQPAGYNVDLTRAVARQMGLSVDIHLAPWAEVRAGLERGDIDAVQGMFYSAERDRQYDFTPPHALVQHVIVVRKDSPALSGMPALAGKAILVMSGDIMEDLAVQHGYERQLIEVESQEEALRRLAAGEGDCALVARVPALCWIDKYGWKNLRVSGKPLLAAELCFAVPEGSDVLLSEFVEGLAAVKRTDDYRAIEAKWLAPYEARQTEAALILRYALYGAVPVLVLLAGALAWTRSLRAQVRWRTQELEDTVDGIRQAEEALRKSEALLRAVMDSSPDPIFLKDLNSRMLLANPATLTLLQKPLDAVLGKTDEEFYNDPEAARRIMANDRRVMSTGQTEAVEEVVLNPGGHRTFLTVKSPYRDSQGNVIGVVGVACDITDRKRAEEALEAARISAERAKIAAEEANRAKDRFLAVLSHELRTPLTPVLAAVSMLQRDTSLEGKVQEKLEIIRRNVEMEARLIDDLLDLTRIARGKVELDRRPVELGTIVQRAVEVCLPDIHARNLDFGVEAPDGPYPVEADAARLQQVFWNLLKNAVKFTLPGGCVGIRCWREGEAHVVVEVNDSGEGIAPEFLPRVFNAFEQEEHLDTRQFGGLGLGLAISKSLVEMHGGSIEARSKGRGKGASFRVRMPLLPVAKDDEANGKATRGSTLSGESGGRALDILYVEDHGDTAALMRDLLELEGHRVQTAGDVATALDLAGRDRFDVLVSDLGLPDGSGIDLMRQLRAQGNGLPGIALSGYGQEQDTRLSREVGFAAHIVKPVSVEQLLEVLTRVTSSQS